MTHSTIQTNPKLTTAPFKADHVGSLLRPDSIHEARKQFKEGTITSEQLREIETTEIKRIVDKQIEVGLKAVTDGEFRRTFWHTDFMAHINGFEGYTPEKAISSKTSKPKLTTSATSARFHSMKTTHSSGISSNSRKSSMAERCRN